MIYTITNRKGGVGKTATAHALGAGLRQRGRRVLFVDLDSQANLSYTLGADLNKTSTLDIIEQQSSVVDSIQATGNGDIIPASERLALADTILTGTGREYRLAEALRPVVYVYDDIIIDTPAQLGILTINALTAANAAIIPVQADVYSMQGMKQLADAIKAVQKYTNKELRVLGVLLTRYQGRAILSRDMRANLSTLASMLNAELFETDIRESIAIKEAAATQSDIFGYSPRSNGAKDYAAFVSEVIERSNNGKEKL